MIGIFGTQYFGKVDMIGDRLYVATRFHHFFLLPLAFQGSFLIVNGANILRIPISLKSILFAYLRFIPGFFLVCAIVGLMGVLLNFSWTAGSWQALGIVLGMILLSVGALYLTYRYAGASPKREQQLLTILHERKRELSPMASASIEFQ